MPGLGHQPPCGIPDCRMESAPSPDLLHHGARGVPGAAAQTFRVSLARIEQRSRDCICPLGARPHRRVGVISEHRHSPCPVARRARSCLTSVPATDLTSERAGTAAGRLSQESGSTIQAATSPATASPCPWWPGRGTCPIARACGPSPGQGVPLPRPLLPCRNALEF